MNLEEDEQVWSKIAYNTDRATDEVLYDHYPGINQKEILGYKIVLSTALEFKYNSYDAKISYTFADQKKLFVNEQEVESTIKDLVPSIF